MENPSKKQNECVDVAVEPSQPHKLEVSESTKEKYLSRRLGSNDGSLSLRFQNSFILNVKSLFRSSIQLQQQFNSIDEGDKLLEFESFDKIENSDGLFAPSYRQKNVDGRAVQSINELQVVGEVARTVLRELLLKLCAETGCDPCCLLIPNLKDADRAIEKAADDYSDRVPGPPLSWVFDVVRASIITDAASISAAVTWLLQNRDVEVVRLKNKFRSPAPGGYRDINISLKLPIMTRDEITVFHICEIQLHHTAIRDLTSSLCLHRQYEYFRTYFRGSLAAISKRLQLIEQVVGEDITEESGGLDELIAAVLGTGDVLRMRSLKSLLYLMCEFKRATAVQLAIIDLTAKTCRESDIALLSEEGELAALMRHCGDLTGAQECLERLVKAKKQHLGIEHASTIESMGKLGELYQDLGLLQQAQVLCQTVCAASASVLGPQHIATLAAKSRLSNILRELGDYSTALVLCAEAAAGQSSQLGLDNLATLSSMNSLGVLHRHMGNFTEALVVLEQILPGYEKHLGIDHVDTMDVVNNIGRAHNKLGNYLMAEKYLCRCLRQQLVVLGDTHPNTLMSMFNLASTLHKLGKLTDSLEIFEDCFQARINKLGKRHPDTVSTANSLANVMVDLKRFDEAFALYDECLEIRLTTLGCDNPDTLQSMNTKVGVHIHRGELDMAKILCEQCLVKRISVLGEGHPDTIATVINLSIIWEKLCDVKQAILHLTEWLVRISSSFGRNPSSSMLLLKTLAGLLLANDCLSELWTLLDTWLLQSEKALGAKHSATLEILLLKAKALEERGSLNQAESLLLRCVEGRIHCPISCEDSVLECVRRLARVLEKQEKFVEAEHYYKSYHDILARFFGDDHTMVFDAKKMVAKMCYKQKKYEEAEELYEECLCEIEAKCSSCHDTERLNALSNLASMKFRLGKLEEAASMFESVLDSQLYINGRGSLRVIEATKNLGRVLVSAHRYDDVEGLYSSLIEDIKDCSPELVGEIPRLQKDSEEIRKRKKVYSGRQGGGSSTRPSHSPAKPSVLNDEQISHKENLLLTRLAIQCSRHGEFSVQVLGTRRELASLYGSVSCYSKAVSTLRVASDIAMKIHGPSHFETIQIKRDLEKFMSSVTRDAIGSRLFSDTLFHTNIELSSQRASRDKSAQAGIPRRFINGSAR